MTPEQTAILHKLMTGSDERLPMGPYVELKESKPKFVAVWHQRRVKHGITLRVCKIAGRSYVDINDTDRRSLLLKMCPSVVHLKDLYNEFDEVVSGFMADALTYGTPREQREQRRVLTEMVLRYSI